MEKSCIEKISFLTLSANRVISSTFYKCYEYVVDTDV